MVHRPEEGRAGVEAGSDWSLSERALARKLSCGHSCKEDLGFLWGQEQRRKEP